MDSLLQFFSDLILFTAGLGVIAIWIVILSAIAIEIYDAFTEKEDEDVQNTVL